MTVKVKIKTHCTDLSLDDEQKKHNINMSMHIMNSIYFPLRIVRCRPAFPWRFGSNRGVKHNNVAILGA